MANTEKICILKRVREVQCAVTGTLCKPGLTQGQRNILDDLTAVLRDIDNLILLNELNACIDDLNDRSKKLKKINARIKRQIENLEEISDKIKQTSKVIDAVVKAFGILVGAGIV